MSYRCKKCGTAVPAGQPLKKITNYRTVKISLDSDRTRREIESEIPVCDECFSSYSTEALAEKFQTR